MRCLCCLISPSPWHLHSAQCDQGAIIGEVGLFPCIDLSLTAKGEEIWFAAPNAECVSDCLCSANRLPSFPHQDLLSGTRRWYPRSPLYASYPVVLMLKEFPFPDASAACCKAVKKHLEPKVLQR